MAMFDESEIVALRRRLRLLRYPEVREDRRAGANVKWKRLNAVRMICDIYLRSLLGWPEQPNQEIRRLTKILGECLNRTGDEEEIIEAADECAVQIYSAAG
jgi:hypothetical protein